MAYPYGTSGAPAIGGGAPGLPRRGGVRGEIMFALPGTYLWTVPDGVYSVCVVCIGGGGNGAFSGNNVASGGAGALAWENDLPVTPGEVITIVVGDRGQTSFFRDTSTCAAGGGGNGNAAGAVAGAGGVVLAGRGGIGGAGAISNSAAGAGASGGATGGYSGPGGNGVSANTSSVAGNAGTGGGAGSGGIDFDNTNSIVNQVGGSGGVAPYGEGASGAGGTTVGSGTNGQGGSGGLNSSIAGGDKVGNSGLFGAGGGASKATQMIKFGMHGCARVVMGDGRFFPSTDVGPS